MKKKCMIPFIITFVLLWLISVSIPSKMMKEKRNYFKGKTTILVDETFHL
jgi:hypothetical protein